MTMSDLRRSASDFWKEFRKVRSGMIGLIFLVVFICILIFEPIIVPYPEVNEKWRDITYWQDLPSSAPPSWINLFTSKKRAVSETIEKYTFSETLAGAMRIQEYVFEYDYSASVAPSDVVFHASGVGKPTVVISIERPDGLSVDLYRKQLETSPSQDARVSIDRSAQTSAMNFGKKYSPSEGVPLQTIKTTDVLFSKAQEGIFRNPEPLVGTYRLKVTLLLQKPDERIDNVFISIAGRVHGILGTDNSKRDIWSGVIAGVKWAMLIGLLTALVSVSIGVVYGVISAYVGGWKDSLMQRIFEIFISVPMLPVLIVMSAVFKPNIWVMIGIMCIFYWVGPVKTVRSMGLQIKEETYIEASRALGASNTRIIFKHMVPLLIPYAFASMALNVPGAIVVEATISLLGLGDATIVTWGQILQAANSGGAMLSGMWWWVVPPGLAIAFMGMTFAFVGFAMDKILNPKLKTR
ncbi:ABC-type dipeptide/oligopeptide/nickel transport system, permease component [Mesotoga prima MesG1.Ag.4.2]|uniref:ABC-type dipeptide/oligopeptide/nickel transport system, permease component n=7 Tax=Kosmotogaceae TaxID=1643948 RepID=I2F6N8_9BACT|nr:ABC-type dipeptide/oligopeptide/nickel transport system, permease component [Mesotoga prima MesG1.Ag.4.2]MCP5457512.1 ABC transporter permease [Thermotogota bacterium]RLL84639.1 ABC transporter permease [Mesotoga sp. H07pep.5.4]CCU84529.1 Binding-protein-dependent transport systems inner membrane component [Mesotoga infera]